MAYIVVEVLGEMVSAGFDEKLLKDRLAVLSPVAAVAFASACAGRLENTYRKLAADDDLREILSQELEAIVKYVKSGLPFDTLAAEEDLLAAMPDEDTNPDMISGVGEDAAAAIVYTLRMIRDRDPQNAVWAARRAYESADREVLRTLNVDEVGDSQEAFILQSPIVQTELQRQSRDLNTVSKISETARAELSAVVDNARSENLLLY